MVKSSYPGQFDTDVELPRVDDNISEIGGDAINSIRDAIFTIEKTLGVDPQGNTADLVTRINGVIDKNGALKAAALASKGLVTLPIVNSHIGVNAAIQESKLDLDYPTTELKASINSNVTDIDTLRTGFTVFVAQTVSHFNGTGNRHDGYDIDLASPIRSSDNVETALNVVNNVFTAHEQSASGAHQASGISVNNEFQNISATDVQIALVELDNLSSGVTVELADTLHATAVARNVRGEMLKQGNLRDTTLAPTIFQTETIKATNILQVMRPNVARITSKNIDLRALKSGQSSVLRVYAGGVERGPLDINLVAILPTEDIDDVVRAINTKAQGCTEHYPISAYNTGGQLTIAHTMPGEDFTITISGSVSNSAHAALGFSDIVNVPVYWSGTSHAAYAGGVRIHDLKPLINIHHNHNTKPLSTIIPGLGDLSQYGISIGNEGRLLCNITNHSTTPTDNGTHYIIAFPTSEKFVLSADIQLGEFDLEIVADAVNFETSSNGEVFDIFVEDADDGYGIVTKYKRISYEPISGVNIRSISERFPSDENVDWQISDGSQIQLYVNNIGGVTVPIPTGFIGRLRAYAPDNINSALFEVTSVPAGGASIKQPITVNAFSGTDDRVYVGSVHYSGNYGEETLKFVTDRRQLGGTVNNNTFDPLKPLPEQDVTNDLRNNGIVRGFEILSSDGSQMTVRGGRAYVNGRPLDVETQEVSVSDYGAAYYMLLLDDGGKFLVKSEFDAGFSFEELMEGDSYGDNRNVATIAQFHTNGTSIDGYEDRRLLIGNIDKRLLDLQTSLNQRIDEVEEVVSGSFWGFTVAQADVDGDGYLASIEGGDNWGFTDIDARGFSAGNNLITTRRFEFSSQDTIQTTIFRPPGLTHINVFIEAVYTGSDGGPFGTSGTVTVDLGLAVETGSGATVAEEYATVKTIPASIFPSSSVVERYVASIPVSQLGLASNIMFDVVPRIRIQGAIYVDGGPGGPDPNPVIRFDRVRIVTSSYSVAGNILGEDGSSSPLATTVGDIL